jgi:hypothetical protein
MGQATVATLVRGAASGGLKIRLSQACVTTSNIYELYMFSLFIKNVEMDF